MLRHTWIIDIALRHSLRKSHHLRGRVDQVLLDVRLQLPHSHVQAGDVLQRAERQYVYWPLAVAQSAIQEKNLHGDILELRLDLDRSASHDHDDLLLIVQHVHLRSSQASCVHLITDGRDTDCQGRVWVCFRLLKHPISRRGN